MMPESYHRFVFDTEHRKFVGRFEEMYSAEDTEAFDSWHERDLRMLRKRISLDILDCYAFSRVLDIGCGKGTFTHLLKRVNNLVVGVDVSAAAIAKATASYADIDFRRMDVSEISRLDMQFDVAVMMAVLAYVEDWRGLLRSVSRMTRWMYVAEYIPNDPIGFVKSADELVAEVAIYADIRTKVILDDAHCMLMGEVSQAQSRSSVITARETP